MEFLKKLLEVLDSGGYSALTPAPKPQDPFADEVDALMNELSHFEVQTWIGRTIDWMVLNKDAGLAPHDTLTIFQSLTEDQKELAFLYLIIAVRGLLDPPSEDHAVVTV